MTDAQAGKSLRSAPPAQQPAAAGAGQPGQPGVTELAPRSAQVAQAVRLTIPVAMAYVPLGIAFGVLMVTSGINWYWAPISALLIFAGSIEFLGVSLIVSGISLFQVALTALVVNFRHVFYGLTFPIERLSTRAQRTYGVFALTDETYGITSAGQGSRLNGFQITILQVVSHFWWVSGALLGSLIGQVIPGDIEGFGFSLTAMFITLAVDAVRSSRDYMLLLLTAYAGVIAFFVDKYVYQDSFLFVGLLIYLALVTWVYVKRKSRRDAERP
jgi:4-azaleucine resistance transporter AzlC